MAQPAEFKTQQTPPPPTDLPVGEILRRTRVHYNKSIPDIETALRIRADQIEAIEQGDNDKLPARVYALGFVRSYSEFLGLDGDKMVDLYKTQSTGSVADEPALNFPVAANDSKAPPLWLVGLCLVIFMIVASIYMGAQDNQRKAVEVVPEVPKALKAEALEQKQKIAPQAPPQENLNEPQVQEPVRKGISLNITENSWVEITNSNGKTVLSRVLKAGEKYFIPERANLTMSLGNAGGVQLEVNGQALETPGGTLGPQGEVMRNIPLNGEVLKQRFEQLDKNVLKNNIESLAQ